jgi:proteic killer suppression protein
MIRSYRGAYAEDIHKERKPSKGFPAELVKVARRKLVMVNTAVLLSDLASPPGNQLEALERDLAGKHSIRVNDQWRVIFRWTDAGPEDVELSKHYK